MNTIYIILILIALALVITITLLNRRKSEQPIIVESKIKGNSPVSSGYRAQELNASKTNNEGIISSQISKQQIPKKPVGWVTSEKHEVVNEITIVEGTNFDVLIVDDSQTVLHYLKNMLTNNGYNVVAKDNGKQALEYLNDLNNIVPNAILTDLEMPLMGGEELILNIKNINRLKRVPIMIVASNPENNIYMLENGIVNGIIRKPFDKDMLIQQVNYLTRS